ncbi:MAG: SpoIIE family protein phosphatase [Lachnospiraceae bacterium]|nr:SpoIIE family protein phosphatase [Lachnospiraceae bacterium]MDD3617218.1 SpoIIE family protein phosphatase [Lachnospiraceae bacterium]
MQVWIVAMLVVSGLLIMRDMAKTIFGNKEREITKEVVNLNPQKERIERYAQSFAKLADTFQEMPSRKEELTNKEIDGIFADVHEKLCGKCRKEVECWNIQRYSTYRKVYDLLRILEEGEEAQIRQEIGLWGKQCICGGPFVDALKVGFYQARQQLLWNNRLLENRAVAAQQYLEVSNIMDAMAKELYHTVPMDKEKQREIQKRAKRRHLLVKNIWMVEKEEYGKEIFMDVKSTKKRKIPSNEAANILSSSLGVPMREQAENRKIIKDDYTTLAFREEVKYQVTYGAARITKEKELVSGDNFYCLVNDKSEFVMCLSDGMGSGLEACKESEEVVELMGQFLQTGFSKETTARLINSALLLQQNQGMYSTLDICSVDLYSGSCDFLKAGAAATFIKKKHWIETISSASMGVGLLYRVDYEETIRNVESGDYVIMVTDGVLDALPVQREEETMKEILMQTQKVSPKEMGKEILEKVLTYCDFRAYDDMTVLVAGISKK